MWVNPKLGSVGALDTETLQQAASTTEAGSDTAVLMWHSIQPNNLCSVCVNRG